jgi:hypothetical protein
MYAPQNEKHLGYKLGDRGSILVTEGIFSSSLHPDHLWGPQNLLSNVYRGDLPPGVKPAILSPSAEVKNAWSCTSTPPHVLIACYLF